MSQLQAQWLSPQEVFERIHQVGNPEWDQRGTSILKTVVEEWKRKRTNAPSVRKSPYGKSFFIKAGTGPKYTASIQDASGRHNCFKGGKRVPCEEFGGQGEGWSELRSQEDLYDALRRLVDELKAGRHDGWHEIIGLLIHTPPEDLQQLKREHGLSVPQDAKGAILKRVQSELQHVGHMDGKSYHVKAEGTPKKHESSKRSV